MLSKFPKATKLAKYRARTRFQLFDSESNVLFTVTKRRDGTKEWKRQQRPLTTQEISRAIISCPSFPCRRNKEREDISDQLLLLLQLGGDGHVHPCSTISGLLVIKYQHPWLRVGLCIALDEKGAECLQTQPFHSFTWCMPPEFPKFVACLQCVSCLYFFTLCSHIKRNSKSEKSVLFFKIRPAPQWAFFFFFFRKLERCL